MEQEKIKKLKLELKELLEWKKEVMLQQVPYPIGFYSKELIQDDLLVFTGNYGTTISADIWLEVEIESKRYWFAATEA